MNPNERPSTDEIMIGDQDATVPRAPRILQIDVPQINYEVVASHPHHPKAFTEGLQFHEGFLYESTGRYGASSLRKVDVKTGHAVTEVPLPGYFAEGLTIFGGELFQLTYRQQVCFVYDLETLQKVKEFHYVGEGWGITNDGQNLIMSNETNQLRVINPKDFETVGGPINVMMNGIPLDWLNELEFVDRWIYANLFPSDLIVRINRNSGEVVAQLDLSALRSAAPTNCKSCVLNGIAYDSHTQHFFVTGKEWTILYEIRLLDNMA